MNTMLKQTEKKARDFFDYNGLVPAFNKALKYAGQNGRVATIPDIIHARLFSKPGDVVWETWYTTLSAEYVGIGKDGRKKIIVCHGIGPMSTLEGILKAYKYQYSDKTRNKRGGRISRVEFLKLESGFYGEVSVIDFEDYISKYKYPFLEVLDFAQASSDPLLKARFGKECSLFLDYYKELACKWHLEQAEINPENRYNLSNYNGYLDKRRKNHLKFANENSIPYIIKLGDACNCSYTNFPLNNNEALAHLLAIGNLVNLHHDNNESLVFDIDCHEWSNSNRFLGIPKNCSLEDGVFKGPDAYNLLKKYWQRLLIPASVKSKLRFCKIMSIGKQWFVEYPKVGARMDTWEIQYPVLSIEKIGNPVVFSTSGGKGTFFFKYDIKEVKTIAPRSANAYYTLGDCWQTKKENHVKVQFCKVEFDSTKRIMRKDDLEKDYDLLMELLRLDESTKIIP
ncbi:MAG: hypothetical protein ACP5OG_02280 [Candidatus Nanoarchaeia archaeon]